ncbi:MAG: polyprenyl synthetase family protein [Opitutaceae bacterium]|nr:polyprenyl synthetase family protein [Opitutaceae bacterium]
MTERDARTAEPPPPGLGGSFVRLQPHLRALDDFLRSQLDGFEPEIHDLVEYCMDTSGKRIRPALVFFSGWRGPDQIPAALVQAAAVVEMVHLATLVHDDIMDRAELRRSRPTAARRYGSDSAVLLGDALLAQAVHIAAQFPSTEVCQVVSAATRRVCAGEIAQTFRRGDTAITRDAYRRVIDLKTAELFRISCLLGARLAGYEDGYVEAAAEFGRSLGIAYQIYDDLADFFGEEKNIGKTLGTDLAGGKVTLPLLVLLEKLSGAERSELLEEIRKCRTPQFEHRRAQMRGHGVFAVVAEDIRAELKKGMAILSPWARLEPALLLGQLGELLRQQVDNLRDQGESS